MLGLPPQHAESSIRTEQPAHTHISIMAGFVIMLPISRIAWLAGAGTPFLGSRQAVQPCQTRNEPVVSTNTREDTVQRAAAGVTYMCWTAGFCIICITCGFIGGMPPMSPVPPMPPVAVRTDVGCSIASVVAQSLGGHSRSHEKRGLKPTARTACFALHILRFSGPRADHTKVRLAARCACPNSIHPSACDVFYLAWALTDVIRKSTYDSSCNLGVCAANCHNKRCESESLSCRLREVRSMADAAIIEQCELQRQIVGAVLLSTL